MFIRNPCNEYRRKTENGRLLRRDLETKVLIKNTFYFEEMFFYPIYRGISGNLLPLTGTFNESKNFIAVLLVIPGKSLYRIKTQVSRLLFWGLMLLRP